MDYDMIVMIVYCVNVLLLNISLIHKVMLHDLGETTKANLLCLLL